MRIPFWLKALWTVSMLVWVPVYWRFYGVQNFLWFCDLGNLIMLAALWLESSLLFSMQATGLLAFQTLFSIDLFGALLSGRHWIGGTEYMFDTHIPFFIRLLSLFHLAMPPLLLWGIWRLGYDRRGWIAQTFLAWIVIPICYFCRPERDVNWARGWGFHEQHRVPGALYLAAYLVIVPVVLFYGTHLLLEAAIGSRRGSR